MGNNIDELNKKFKELVQRPIKSKQEIGLQQEIAIALEKAFSEEEIELVKNLKSLGLNILSVWDLVNTKESSPAAIPTLIEHLQKDYHEKNKEGIIRALAVKEANGKASPILIAEYNRVHKDRMLLRWAIGNTIYTTITENDVDSILPIVEDKTNGMSRQMFVAALGKVKSEKAKDKISELTNHPKALIKKEALKALKKIS